MFFLAFLHVTFSYDRSSKLKLYVIAGKAI